MIAQLVEQRTFNPLAVGSSPTHRTNLYKKEFRRMTKLMYRDIPQMVHGANYAVDIGWEYLPCYYAHAVVEYQLDVNPNFQRHYVWTPEQKVRYVEYILRGGPQSEDVIKDGLNDCRYWNCWRGSNDN